MRRFIPKAIEDSKEYLQSKDFLYTSLGVLLLLGLWHIASLFMHKIMIASPYHAFTTLIEMMSRERFWEAVGITSQRAVSGILLGGLVGFVFGIMAGLNDNIKNLFEPIRWMVMSISPVIVVSIAMMWFGMGTQMVVFIAAVLLAPIVYVNTIKGIQMVDERIIEMANVYKFSLFQKLKHIYIPALVGPLSAAMTIVLTAGMRMIILAEVLGTNSGIGYEFSFAKTDMNTPEVFAWVIVTLIFVGIAEFIFFKPIENYLLRWKN
jgi:NitT/TauT family transport system permease protein